MKVLLLKKAPPVPNPFPRKIQKVIVLLVKKLRPAKELRRMFRQKDILSQKWLLQINNS